MKISRKITAGILVMIALLLCSACGAGATTTATEAISYENGTFSISDVTWRSSPDALQEVKSVVQFPAGSEVEDYMSAQRVYFTTTDGEESAMLCGTQYTVEPLYEFEYGELINVSLTLTDASLSSVSFDTMLTQFEEAYGSPEETAVDAPSGETIMQYNWIGSDTKCTLSATYEEEQVVAVAVNVMLTA